MQKGKLNYVQSENVQITGQMSGKCDCELRIEIPETTDSSDRSLEPKILPVRFRGCRNDKKSEYRPI